MKTAFQQLVDAVATALRAVPAVAGGRVFENRLRPLAAGDSVAVVVRLHGTQGTNTVMGARDWRTQLLVECYGRGVGAVAADEAVDALLPLVLQRVSGLDLAALAVTRWVVGDEIQWERDVEASSDACATLRLEVWHRTAADSFFPWGN